MNTKHHDGHGDQEVKPDASVSSIVADWTGRARESLTIVVIPTAPTVSSDHFRLFAPTNTIELGDHRGTVTVVSAYT